MPAAKRSGTKFRLGLAGRVVLIACGAAIVATIAQWVLTPLLLRSSFDNGRLVYISASARQLAMVAVHPMERGDIPRLGELARMMSSALPDGEAAILDEQGRVLGATPHADSFLPLLGPHLLDTGGSVLHRGAERIAYFPIILNGKRIGSAMVACKPRDMATVWLDVVARNALVLVLALFVIAPFMLPLARKALSPLTKLERRIRSRAASDKSALAEDVEDKLIKPLLSAIDEVHERSDAATRRAMRLAFADPVTRLPNRLRFMSKLEGLVDRKGAEAAFLIVADIDNFRKINGAVGPRVADQILVQVAERLKASAAQVAGGQFFLGRVGPDQFGIIAAGADRAMVKAFMAMADRAISEPITLDGQVHRITASFGSAHAPDDASLAADLVKQSELALKEAKRSPATRRAFYDGRLLEKAKEQSRLEADIRAGLERGEFIAVFQPKVELGTGELVGAEALARWRRPDGAVVSPGVFVPIAEELGLIGKLGNCVLRDACFAAAEWNRRGIVSRIAVNVSPYQFNEADFVSNVQLALDESGLDPKLLELEITESAAVEDPDRVARTMWPLRSQGVRLAIDDFGTGHSNFTSITRLPFDVFKIDQQFIRALSTDPHAPAIVEMILAMAEALGQETVAEGVETREQADFLLRRNCTIGQGYYFSPPLPAAEFDAFVRSWRPRPASRFAA